MSQDTSLPITLAATDDLTWLFQLLEGYNNRKERRIVALIPAHNEEDGIAKTVKSLLGQTIRPDLIVVMADNCTDRTVERAWAAGAYVVETKDNKAKKAGALNQGIKFIIPWLQPDDYFIFQDADGELDPEFIANAYDTFDRWKTEHRKKPLGGLSGAIVAREATNFIERAQAIEYARGTRLMSRQRGKVHVLSGAASILPVFILQKLADQRGVTLPGEPGTYFMEDSLTEDYELTLAIRHMGYDCTSTRRCPVVTDLMPNLPMLEIQRVRWYRGAMESLALYGVNKITWRTWGGVLFTFFSSTLFPLALLGLVFSYLVYSVTPNPLYWALLPIFMTENIVVARRVDRKAFWTAVSFVPLWAYDNLMFIVYWRSLFQAIGRSKRVWIT